MLHMFRLAHTSSIDSKTQETNYNLLTRWYRVPAALLRIYPIGLGPLLARLRPERHAPPHLVGMPVDQSVLARSSYPHKVSPRDR